MAVKKKQEQEGKQDEINEDEMNEMIYKCDRTWCQKEFRYKSHLNVHKVNHEWRHGDPEDEK